LELSRGEYPKPGLHSFTFENNLCERIRTKNAQLLRFIIADSTDLIPLIFV
jgi:hypothetical protein